MRDIGGLQFYFPLKNSVVAFQIVVYEVCGICI